jgi:hypothetical protein
MNPGTVKFLKGGQMAACSPAGEIETFHPDRGASAWRFAGLEPPAGVVDRQAGIAPNSPWFTGGAGDGPRD